MTEEKDAICCESEEIHEEAFEDRQETMPDETELDALAELFKVFGTLQNPNFVCTF